MRVKKLIRQLRKMPDSAEVHMIFDGADRGDVDCLWLARSGAVVLSDAGVRIYYGEDRPKEAPEDGDWSAPGRNKGCWGS